MRHLLWPALFGLVPLPVVLVWWLGGPGVVLLMLVAACALAWFFERRSAP